MDSALLDSPLAAHQKPDFTPRTYEATHKGFFCRRHLQQYGASHYCNHRITVRCCAFPPVKTRSPASSFRFRRPRKLLIGSHAFFPRFPSFLEAFLQGPLIICSPETSQPLQAFTQILRELYGPPTASRGDHDYAGHCA
jgi:hypothetical protein